MTWKMPPEWHPHERTWMAFPTSGYTLGESPTDEQTARQTWANVANAVSEFEKVSMVINPGDENLAKKLLSSEIELFELPLNDAWMRDIGPTFVLNDQGELGAVDWVFNGWGAQSWASWDKDSKIAGEISKLSSATHIPSELVNEGGGIHVSSNGVVLLTETVQQGAGRNPHLSKAEIEKEIHEKLGTHQAIWIKRGLTRDYDEFGTRGHIDIVACFAPNNTVLYHDQRNPNHPDYLVSQEVREVFMRAGFETMAIEAPEVLSDHEGFVDYSYINHYTVNNGVILCSFNDAKDKEAKAKIREAYPGREVVLVEATELFARGGGIHCITQQQPRASR